MCLFSNAELPDEDKAALKPYAKHLFTALSSTAIGNDGIAMEHSLRRIEVALPCVLTGEIMRWPDDEKVRTRISQMMTKVRMRI